MAGWFTRLFGPSTAPRPPVVVTTTDTRREPAANPTVLVDTIENGMELAEIKPMGVVVPKNRQELIEELRKNYADVIELVRKVNTHLDQQSLRQDQQDRRADQMLQVAQGIAGTLESIHQSNARLVEIMQTLEVGQNGVREAIVAQSRSQLESATQVHSAIQSIRDLAAQSQETSRVVSGTLERVGTTLGEVGGSTQRLVNLVESGTQARVNVERELLRRADQTRWLGLAAALAGILLVGAAAMWILMNRG